MSLHARSVASAAGALDDEVELVARRLSERREVSVRAAQTLLDELRAQRRGGVGQGNAEKVRLATAPRTQTARATLEKNSDAP
jgi:hypothetical protein